VVEEFRDGQAVSIDRDALLNLDQPLR